MHNNAEIFTMVKTESCYSSFKHCNNLCGSHLQSQSESVDGIILWLLI